MILKDKNLFQEKFNKRKILIGTIHLLPLPGSPKYENTSMTELIDYSIKEGLKYQKGGMDAVIIENGGDIPYIKEKDLGYETISSMSVIANEVRKALKIPIGIVINWNATKASMAVAKASSAVFIRANQWVNAYISNSGYMEGKSGLVRRYQNNIGAKNITVLADVMVKHGSHAIVSDRFLVDQVHDLEFYDADGILVTGNKTGDSINIDDLKKVKENTQLPVLIGSGLKVSEANKLMSVADGAIVASSLKEDNCWWKEVNLTKVKKLVDKIRSLE